MKRIRLTTFALVTSASLVAVEAFADPPPQCGGGRRRTYQLAYDGQKKFLNTLFQSSYDCNSLEDFTSAMRLLVLRSTITNECQRAGIEDATNDVLDDVARQCFTITPHEGSPPLGGEHGASFSTPEPPSEDASCEQMGRERGAFAANMYCSLGLIGVHGQLCPAIFRFACEKEFYRVISTNPSCSAGRD